MRPGSVLDSSVIIEVQRGSAPALRTIANAITRGPVVLPAMAALEVRAGREAPKRWRRWLEELEQRLGVASLDLNAAIAGARVVRQVARAGRTLASADAAVVGCGLVRGATVVVTADGDFDALPPPFTVERVPRRT